DSPRRSRMRVQAAIERSGSSALQPSQSRLLAAPTGEAKINAAITAPQEMRNRIAPLPASARLGPAGTPNLSYSSLTSIPKRSIFLMPNVPCNVPWRRVAEAIRRYWRRAACDHQALPVTQSHVAAITHDRLRPRRHARRYRARPHCDPQQSVRARGLEGNSL